MKISNFDSLISLYIDILKHNCNVTKQEKLAHGCYKICTKYSTVLILNRNWSREQIYDRERQTVTITLTYQPKIEFLTMSFTI